MPRKLTREIFIERARQLYGNKKIRGCQGNLHVKYLLKEPDNYMVIKRSELLCLQYEKLPLSANGA